MVKDNLPQSKIEENFRFIYLKNYTGIRQEVVVKNKGKVKIELKYPEINGQSFDCSFKIFGKNDVDSTDATFIKTVYFHTYSYESQYIDIPEYKYIKIQMSNDYTPIPNLNIVFGVTLYS